LYLRGRTLNASPEFSAESESSLSKAIKLKPSLAAAWNELGESYFKKGDVDAAKTCFLGALEHVNAKLVALPYVIEGTLQGQDKVSLRNLSIVMRQKLGNSNKEKMENIEGGLTKAREASKTYFMSGLTISYCLSQAVQLDTSDSVSWSILGNAYFMHFFAVSQNPKTLKQAMSAYKQAEKGEVAKSSADLWYNKGVVRAN